MSHIGKTRTSLDSKTARWVIQNVYIGKFDTSVDRTKYGHWHIDTLINWLNLSDISTLYTHTNI